MRFADSVGIEQIVRTYPQLQKTAFRTVRHPHYRSVLTQQPRDLELRNQLGIRDDRHVFSMLGTLRASKKPELVAREFALLSQDRFHLLLAGQTDPATSDALRSALAGCRNCTLELRRLSQAELAARYALTDIAVFPAVDYFNSGTIYTALSLNVPILAGSTPVNLELQSLVGPEWLHLPTPEEAGGFRSHLFEEAASRLVPRSSERHCNLDPFEPQRCAEEQLRAYEYALGLPQAI